jgi:stearoyl-CoA desaturase (delta-9 desaturase)
MEFTRFRFLLLTILAHIGFWFSILTGTFDTWVWIVVLFVVFTLISTTFYHRLLSHRAWDPHWLIENIGVFLGVFTLTGTPLTRTAVHRAHHKFADTTSDPHSPKHSTLLQMYLPQIKEFQLDLRSVKDILRNKYLMWIHRW